MVPLFHQYHCPNGFLVLLSVFPGQCYDGKVHFALTYLPVKIQRPEGVGQDIKMSKPNIYLRQDSWRAVSQLSTRWLSTSSPWKRCKTSQNDLHKTLNKISNTLMLMAWLSWTETGPFRLTRCRKMLLFFSPINACVKGNSTPLLDRKKREKRGIDERAVELFALWQRTVCKWHRYSQNVYNSI